MSDKKIVIQPNTVQETLLIPLYGRKYCTETYPDMFHDQEACHVVERIDYAHPKPVPEFECIESGLRQYDFICEIKDYLKDHPKACLVNLGCGLDAVFQQVDNGQIKCYNLDLPEIIAARNELMPPIEREYNIVCDINNNDWYNSINYKEEDGIFIFVGGVFYYFTYDKVQKIITDMAEHFKGGVLIFDYVNRFGIMAMQNVTLRKEKGVKVAFYFSDAEKEMKSWTPSIVDVKSTPYIHGYHPIDKRWKYYIQFMCWFIQKLTNCNIARVTFK